MILLLAGFFWGFGFVGNKVVLDAGWTDSQLLFFRFIIALVIMFAFQFRKILAADKKTFIRGLILGVFLYLGFFFQTWGLVHTTASNNALVTAAYIILLPIVTYVVEKKHVDWVTKLAGFITFFGVAVIAVDFNDLTIAYGDVLTLVGTVFYAIHIYLLGKSSKKMDAFLITFFQLITFVVFAFIVMMSNAGLPDFTLKTIGGFNITLVVTVLAFFASFLAFYFQTVGQKFTNESEAAILISTEAVFAPIMAIMLLGDPFSMKLLFGGILVFIGIVLNELDLSVIIQRNEKSV
jgi:drug/metabolite transporter (DMT)-like permease